jgi:hypothetical protein
MLHFARLNIQENAGCFCSEYFTVRCAPSVRLTLGSQSTTEYSHVFVDHFRAWEAGPVSALNMTRGYLTAQKWLSKGLECSRIRNRIV